jgi:hypothetical protein
MRRLAATAALALLAAACSTSPCQELGEKLCSCSGASQDDCKRQVEFQLEDLHPDQATEDRCDALLGSCNPPPGAELCEWLLTEDGKVNCGLAPEPPPASP